MLHLFAVLYTCMNVERVWDSSKRTRMTTSKDIAAEKKTNKSIEGKLLGYIFTVLTLKFALDSTLESVKKISLMGWEMDSFLDCFSISFLTKEIVPKSNINGSKSENHKRCFHRNKTIFSRWSWNGGFKSKKHGKSLLGEPVWVHSFSLIKKIKNKLSKREQTEPEHHKKPQTLFVSSPK